jgi:hypothetical protein
LFSFSFFSHIDSYIAFTMQRYQKYHKREFDPMTLSAESPTDITAYIYHKCEPKDTKNTQGVLQGCEGLSYSTAMKIRAAITNYYDSLLEDNLSNFGYDEQSRRWVGNPSKSSKVINYMTSLKKRKAKTGEQAKTMRAITSEDLKHLYTRCEDMNTVVAIRQYVSAM